jgi:hypothetical protein
MEPDIMERPERLSDTPYCQSRNHCRWCRRDPEIRENIARVFGVLRDGSGCPEGFVWDDPRVPPLFAHQATSPCDGAPQHATWCHRFGFPTGPAACDACTRARDAGGEFAGEVATLSGGVPVGGEEGMPFAAWFTQWLRIWGEWHRCKHRIATGETREEVCCGGRVKKVPVLACELDPGGDCRRCGREKR